MKIKTRILLSNTLMVLLSLVALLIVGGFVIDIWGRQSASNGRDPTEEMAALLNSVNEAAQYEEIKEKADGLGFSFYIFSLSKETLGGRRGAIPELELQDLSQSRHFYIEDKLVVARTLPYSVLLAVSKENMPAMDGVGGLMTNFWVVGCIAIAVIIAISYIFTLWLLKFISRPLSALTEASVRVELGDLSQPIGYRGKDDFKTLCDSFDHMQSHLKEERDKNAAYEKARADLVTGISHDLRTPLTSVRGYIKGIQDGIANTPEKIEHYLRTAYEKAGEMDVLLQRLFFFSKVETGNLPLNKKNVELTDLIRYYVDEASLDPMLQSVAFQTDYGTGEHTAAVDVGQLRRVFNNLTENAVKYSSRSPVTISVKLFSDGSDRVIIFRDDGQGVDPSLLPHIFEQFRRGDSARKEGGSSSGLGLYIVKYIIDAHGGSIEAENDNGLKFTIRLPMAKEDCQP